MSPRVEGPLVPSRSRALLATVLAPVLAAALLPLAAAPAAAAPAPRTLTPLASAPRTPAPLAGELGHDRLGVRRGDTWHLSSSLDGAPGRSLRDHVSGWRPVAGDTNGDGTSTVHLFQDGWWRIRDVEGGAVRSFHFGLRRDQPVLGDWNGDGRATIGVFRSGRWFLRDVNASGPARVVGFGLPRDVAVVGDWDGDGRTGIAVRRGATWYQRDTATAGAAARTFRFGLSGDSPVAGDWDHDGRDTPGLFRDGSWLLRGTNGSTSGYTTTAFGQRGDRPVVRRTPGLAPGLSHHVLRDPQGPFVSHVAVLAPTGSARPDTVLAGGRLAGLEPTTGMARRAGAVLGVNGDYALASGRPVHLFARDGRLAQSPQLLGRAVGFDATGTRVQMGFPDLRVRLEATADGGGLPVPRWNSGQGDGLGGFTADGALLETPPAEACYAGLAAAGEPTVRADGAVQAPVTVTGTRCGGPRPVVPTAGAVLSGRRASPAESAVRRLVPGQPARLSTLLGFPGAVDVIGGNPMLVSGGEVVRDVDGQGAFFARHPRTAVGVTADGHLLLVVVDGRRSGYSAGMTLRELARHLRALGAVEAVNLDGGGSATMVVNGVVANRPSDGAERPVSSALVVLPDRGRTLTGLQLGPGTPDRDHLRREDRDPAPPDGPDAAATDPGSTGGLADAHRRAGVPLPAELRRTAQSYLRAEQAR
jgi:hypothetical protein